MHKDRADTLRNVVDTRPSDREQQKQYQNDHLCGRQHDTLGPKYSAKSVTRDLEQTSAIPVGGVRKFEREAPDEQCDQQ